MKPILFLFLSLFSLFSTLCQAEEDTSIVRRAALDIGSGQIKLLVADVDLKKNRITQVLFTDSTGVALREDLTKSKNNQFSAEIQNQAVDAIKQLIEKAESFHPVAYQAIATASLRQAENGQSLAEKIKNETGLPVSVISQKEEGILGFITAVSVADSNPDTTISFDYGGGSFQITAKCNGEYIVFQGTLGKVPFKNAILEIQGKNEDLSPNPISKEEVNQAIEQIQSQFASMSPLLIEKLKDPSTRVLGVGINPLWGIQSQGYDIDRLRVELNQRIAKSDDEILLSDPGKLAPFVVVNMIGTYAFMDAFGIKEIKYSSSAGSNVGLMLSQKYWKD